MAKDTTANTNQNQNEESVQFKVICLLPTDESGVFSARIFNSKTDLRKAVDLAKLPKEAIILRGRELARKVETVVRI